MAEYIIKNWSGKYKTLLIYAPDHGQRLTDGGTGAHGSLMTEDMNILHFYGVFD